MSRLLLHSYAIQACLFACTLLNCRHARAIHAKAKQRWLRSLLLRWHAHTQQAGRLSFLGAACKAVRKRALVRQWQAAAHDSAQQKQTLREVDQHRERRLMRSALQALLRMIEHNGQSLTVIRGRQHAQQLGALFRVSIISLHVRGTQ